MYGEVWKWAGSFRKTNKNLGVDKFQIGIELRKLLDDTKYWIENKSFSEDEIAVRFSHRMVQVHLFPNGNGRHSRLIGDILVNHVFSKPVFSWGGTNLSNAGTARTQYISALKEADEGSYKSLLDFIRS